MSEKCPSQAYRENRASKNHRRRLNDTGKVIRSLVYELRVPPGEEGRTETTVQNTTTDQLKKHGDPQAGQIGTIPRFPLEKSSPSQPPQQRVFDFLWTVVLNPISRAST